MPKHAERVIYHPTSTQDIIVRRIAFADVIGRGALNLSRDMQEIGRAAWGRSDWLTELAGSEHRTRQIANSVFETQGTGINDRRSALRRSLVGADTYYVAERRHGTVGWARMRNDISGNPLEKVAKRVRNTRVYAAIGNVCIEPTDQRLGTGAALVYTGLQDMHPDHPVTTYTTTNNVRLIDKLELYGFAVTGSRPRPDLYGDIAVEEVRLQGPSNADLQERMKSRHGWLARADILSR